MKKIIPLLFIFALSCVSSKDMIRDPENYFYISDIPMEWDGEYPVQVWRATIKLDEPIEGFIDGYEYTLSKLDDPYQDSLYILQVKLFE
jgi:hypothetical protein